MNRLKVALVGYGYAGKTFHAPLIVAAPGLHLTTVVSSDPAKVHADYPDVNVVAHAAEALADPQIDLVVIAAPNDQHFPLAQAALAAGKHVVVDKPFTTTLAEARNLIAQAKEVGKVLSVFQNRRWDADFLTVKKLLADDDLGRVVHFESHFDRFRPVVRQRWREAAGLGNGLWFDLGPHLVDQALQLFGRPEAVYADLAVMRDEAVATDYFHVILRYEGLRVILHGSTLVAGGPRFVIHGDKRSFIKQGLDTQEAQLKAGGKPGDADWGKDPLDGVLITSVNDVEETAAVVTKVGDYRAYYNGVAAAIAEGKPNPVSGEEALAVMAVIELAHTSASMQRELPFTV
ncbi:putative dehydrogenase [Silvimonas terrae]|uniref:Putative dehydrogenase n=1 Tax=Silvimonas terrae TaxID=300266 RepID=A0A840RC02_9NEIS|nr:oxidoreductase [Silvimonas terrae]MBB5190467.1 putative dehydrogenase [Silvimonas terrae]